MLVGAANSLCQGAGNMSKRLQGGCQCGAVRYETAAAPAFSLLLPPVPACDRRRALVAIRFACDRGPCDRHLDSLSADSGQRQQSDKRLLPRLREPDVQAV